jgi:hypothetical protein
MILAKTRDGKELVDFILAVERGELFPVEMVYPAKEDGKPPTIRLKTGRLGLSQNLLLRSPATPRRHRLPEERWSPSQKTSFASRSSIVGLLRGARNRRNQTTSRLRWT